MPTPTFDHARACGAFVATVLALAACQSGPASLREADPGTGPVVNFDLNHVPFPEIPLPNDFATRYDPASPTGRRLNVSVEAGTTDWERATRADLNQISGWGTLAPITVSFDAPIDPEIIYAHQHHDIPDPANDVVLVVNVTESSPGFCETVPLDMGRGHYPTTLPNPSLYPSDPRASLQQLMFDEVEEDLNQNGKLDPGEDTDMDGVLDHPNTRSGQPGDPVMDFYERETHTLIMKPLVPMRENTTYAAVLTRRLASPSGEPVRSPFAGINDAAQTPALAQLPTCLSKINLSVSDVAFTWSFTTQVLTEDYKRVRDGLYGVGPLAKLSTDFPAAPSKLWDMVTPGPGVTSVKEFDASLLLPLVSLLANGNTPGEVQAFTDNWKFVDFIAVGDIQSPQFAPRFDDKGAMLPLYKQVWDLDTPPRTESVPFMLFVPKNRKGPAPVSIFIHGHGGDKVDAALIAGVLARYGIATLSFTCPSHGLSLSASTLKLASNVLANSGLSLLEPALLDGRAYDWNNDGVLDPGADYWSSYVFHTRDEVRQTMVDLMELVRMVRTFDGSTRWSFDVTGGSNPGLAGDFNGDGVVDVGGGLPITLLGGSLGGITGALAAGVEPQIQTLVGVVPGGMLSEVGMRSQLGAIRNAMVLRMMEPIFYGVPTGTPAAGGVMPGVLTEHVSDAQTSDLDLSLHALPTLNAQDTVVLLNQRNGEYRCGAVLADGSFRVTVPADKGDALEFRAYAGPLPPLIRNGCVIPSGVMPTVSVTSVDRDVMYDGVTTSAGSPLVAVTDGYGLKRATPDLRRLAGLAQIAMDSADPMNWAPYWDKTRTMTYGNGESPGAHVLLIPSDGDPGVPVATGIALSRAAGFIDFNDVDTRYGKSDQQELIDQWSVEGVARMNHFTVDGGVGVLMDVEDLSAITGANDGWGVPRLSPPLHLPRLGADGKVTGVLIPMLKPQGLHGFVTPDPGAPFDLGSLLFNMIGRYLSTNGTSFDYDPCQVTSTCSWIPPVMP